MRGRRLIFMLAITGCGILLAGGGAAAAIYAPAGTRADGVAR